ncbi:hypothetical protein EDB83DRAFT_2325458 [Lactarius deliciosus]|nr:hypothetical protein EDB83DRAFT_2325458 [Lactarius deliciosus]
MVRWGVVHRIGDVAGRQWQGLGVAVSRHVAGCCAPCWGSVEVRGVACRIGDMAGRWWRGLGVTGGMGVSDGGALCAVLGQRGGGLAIEVLRAMLGRHSGLAVAGCWGRDRSGSCARMACNVQGLARRVGVARWVGSGGISGHDGGGSRAQMACNVQGLACHVGAAQQVGGGSVLRAMLGQGQMAAAHVHEGAAMAVTFRLSGKKKRKKKNRKHIMLHWDKAQGLKGRVWRGRTRGGSGRTGRSKDCILVLGYIMSSGGLICGVGIFLMFFSYHHAVIPHGPSPLRKIEDMAEDELAFGAMHKICHCRPLVHASHLGHLHSSPPQHAAPTWRTWPTSLASHATLTWLATPRHRHPNIARNTPTTAPPQYGTQHPTTANPTDPPCRLNAARKVQPPPTPTPP